MSGWTRRQLGWAGLGALAGGCTTNQRGGDGSIRVAIDAVIESMDPLMTINEYPVFRSIFDSLARIDAEGRVTPRLATRWESNGDATDWLFDLREDAVWSDGRPVTLDDVLFSLETIRAAPTSLNRQYLAAVDSISAAGRNAVRFRLRTPFAAWPRQLSLLSVVPHAAYARLGSMGYSAKPTSSGPYRVSDWGQGTHVDLIAHPQHWGGSPPIRHVRMVSVPDESARLNAIQAGDIDAIRITPHQAPLLDRFPGVELESVGSNRVVYLGFNVMRGPLADVRVRQAIDCAIDRAAICRYLLRGSATPAGQLVAPGTVGYDPALNAVASNPARARALLAEAGYRGEPIAFQYPSNGPIPLVHYVAEAIGGQLAEIGLNVTMRSAEQNGFIGDWIGGELEGVWLFAFNPSTMDAELVTATLMGPGGVRSFADSVLDRLEAEQLCAVDPLKRAATFARMWARMREQAWYAPLFNDLYVYAHADRRVRFLPRRDGYIAPEELRPVSGFHGDVT